MRLIPLTLIACLIAQPALAQTRIRDLSMSPQETIRQSGQPSAPPPAPAPTYNAAPAPASQPMSHIASDGRFMGEFCDPNFKSALARDAATQACLKQQREQNCDQFYHLPTDVQAVLEDSLKCSFDAPATGESCGDSDTQRLLLLKRYWSDPAIAHALVFLPGDMQNPARCTGGR